MTLYLASLNSGSNGNCYYIGTEKEAILVDAGISCREIETRMGRQGLNPGSIKALFVSHEHSDHIKGVAVFSRKYEVPVYITDATRRSARIKLDKKLSYTFSDNVPISIGGLTILPFTKKHDAVDPYSFTISCNQVNIGVFTDIGTPCKQLISHFKNCHAVFLETNYDEDMLENGSYPLILKKRISGGKGHLSNKQALEVFLNHRSKHLSHLFLSHLSKNNNDPQLVKQLFQPHAGNTEIIVLSRYEESKVYVIDTARNKKIPLQTIPLYKPKQLQLFE